MKRTGSLKSYFIGCLWATALTMTVYAPASFAGSSKHETMSQNQYFSIYNMIKNGYYSGGPVAIETLDKMKGDLLSADSLVDSTGQKLTLPPLPRRFSESYITEVQDTTTALSINLSAIAATIPLNGISSAVNLGIEKERAIKYSYSKAVTLMIMSSMNARSADLPSYKLDPITKSLSFIEAPGENLVGFCRYEMKLEMKVSDQGAVKFIVGSHTINKDKVRGEALGFMTNGFLIDPKKSPEYYLNNYCNGEALYPTRVMTEMNFNMIVTSFHAYNNPSNECEPSAVNPPAAQGDDSCQGWFEARANTQMKQRFVPRCVQQNSGAMKCEMRVKAANLPCTMYMDQNLQYSVERPLIPSLRVTPTRIGFPEDRCDFNLSCQLVTAPVIKGFYLEKPGQAVCR